MSAPSKPCKDCMAQNITTMRPAPHPGPRCTTHHRLFKKETKSRTHGNRVEKTYGITADEYARIKQHQGGKCYMCQKATGATKALAVDHRHSDNLVRGLLCSPCNVLIGRAGDDVMFFIRGIEYLTNPPAVDALGGPRYAPM